MGSSRTLFFVARLAGWLIIPLYVARLLPGHVRLVRQLLLDPLDRRDTAVLTDLLKRVRDHMRAAPPRSAAPRSRRT